MFPRLVRNPAVALCAAAILAACGGGGGGGGATLPPGGGGGGGGVPTATPSPTATPTATPTLPPASSASTSIGVSSAVTLTLPPIAAGIGASAQLPATTLGTATITGTLSAAIPAGLPAPSSVQRVPASIGTTQVNPIAFVQLTVKSGSVTTATSIGLNWSLSGSVTAPNGLYVALYDGTKTANAWTVYAGPATASNGTVSFAAPSPPFSFVQNGVYTFMLFAPGGTYATPSPSPSPTPTPVPTASPAPISSASPCTSGVDRQVLSRKAARSNGAEIADALYVTHRQGARSALSLNALAGVRATQSLAGGTVLRFESAAAASSAMASLQRDGAVESVSHLHRRSLLSCNTAVNDPRFDTNRQWYLFRSNVPAAWAYSHGAGIKVAVIDTGADETDPDLSGKIVYKERVLTPKGGTQQVTECSAAGGCVQDHDGHGTNVAGLVGAQVNNGFAVASTGWDVQLMIFEIFDDPTKANGYQVGADTADEAKAINDAVSKGADVISLSLGSPQSTGADKVEQAAIAAAINAGVVVVAAAGNEFDQGTGGVPDYPGGYPGVIAVGASAADDTTPNLYSSIFGEHIAYYSNSGSTLVAPGGDSGGDPSSAPPDYLHWIYGLVSSTVSDPSFQCSGLKASPPYPATPCVALYNGTSQATPQVSAAIALMLAKHGGPRSLSPDTVRTTLINTADPLPGIGSDRQGAGRLNVLRAVTNV